MSSIIPVVGKEFPEKVIPLIENAKQTIDIIVFDWRWYPDTPGSLAQQFNFAICNAAKRGVKIRVITNSVSILDILRKFGITAKKLNIKNLVHAKMMIIDGRLCVIGSHNYTENAFQINFEISAIISDSNEMPRFQQFFDNLFFSYA